MGTLPAHRGLRRLFAAPRVAGVARFSQMASEASEVLRPSKRIRVTDEPCIVAMQRMLRGKQGILSLAQGIVFWKPPEEATEAARRAAQEPDTNSYGASEKSLVDGQIFWCPLGFAAEPCGQCSECRWLSFADSLGEVTMTACLGQRSVQRMSD
ncbi:unnamed protein product [Effrenium voratum]|uniref:Uncharacterized protein n=1 Tax=Effrenium voratum TaxID=2562239 RepID=A0AA36IPR3_9DINO|nr:unnamed protein product [Effrenium voratum]